MARIPFIAGNWKMNTTIDEAIALAKGVAVEADTIDGVEKVVCPPFISIQAVAEAVRGTTVKMGAQNIYFEDRGAFTGEISPVMLKGLCEYVIIGHSERRIHFGDKDYQIALKVAAALKHGLIPIICVGENADQKENGGTASVVAGQLLAALREVAPGADVVIAYEPVWAIGTGAPAQPEEANQVGQLIREQLAGRHSREWADKTRVLYGGSVTSRNVGDFLTQPDVDGALVGTASLRSDEFNGIMHVAQEVAKTKLAGAM